MKMLSQRSWAPVARSRALVWATCSYDPVLTLAVWDLDGMGRMSPWGDDSTRWSSETVSYIEPHIEGDPEPHQVQVLTCPRFVCNYRAEIAVEGWATLRDLLESLAAGNPSPSGDLSEIPQAIIEWHEFARDPSRNFRVMPGAS